MYIIVGQTATGKTQLGYDLAKKHHGELINFDSRQVYKHLDIITGKTIFPDIKTHLIDLIDPKEQFSSFDFVSLARPLITKLAKKRITPILVGGTYLYLKHLLYGIDTQIPPNWKLRGELNKKSVKQLQEMLKTISLQSFERLNNSDRSNPHRLIRRIELEYFMGGKRGRTPDSAQFVTRQTSTGRRETLDRTHKIIGLRFKSRGQLKHAIEKRVEQRIKNGAFQEVKHLIKNGYKLTDPGLNTIGYKQIFDYYNGKVSKEKTIEQWISKELQYAKRQYTFMKKNKDINWKII